MMLPNIVTTSNHNTSSEPSPPIRGWKTAWLPVLFIAILVLIQTGPALFLPWSFVDDPVFMSRASIFWRSIAALEFGAAWDVLGSSVFYEVGGKVYFQGKGVPTFGFTVNLFAVVLQGLFGNNPFFWHLAKSFTYFAFLAGLYRAGREVRFSRGACLAGVWLSALFNPWWVFQDYQSYFFNWVRLFTTDSFHIVFTVWQIVFFAECLNRDDVSRKRIAALMLSGLLAWITKVMVLYTLPAFVAVLIWNAWHRRQFGRREIGILLALVLPWIAGLFYFRPWAGQQLQGYHHGLNTAWPLYSNALIFFRNGMFDSLGAVLLAGVILSMAALVRRSTAVMQKMMIALMLMLFAGGYAVQCLWYLLTPRYMISFMPFMTALCGWMIWPWLIEVPLRLFKNRPWANIAVSWGGGFLLWMLAIIPPIISQRQTPWRFYPVLTLIAVGAALWAVWGILKVIPKFKTLTGLKWLLVLPLALLQGNFLHQSLLNLASQFDAYQNNIAKMKRDMTWSREMINHIDPDRDIVKVMVSPALAEVGLTFEMLAHQYWDMQNVDYVPYNEKDLSEIDYLVSCSQRVHLDAEAYGVAVWDEHIIKKVEATPKGSSALIMRSGDQINLPHKSAKPLKIVGLFFVGDTHPWHSDLNLTCTLSIGDQVSKGAIQGEEIPRARSSPPPCWLDKPLVVNKDDTININLACELAGGESGNDRVGSVVFSGWRHSGGLAPVFVLLTGEPLPENMERIYRHTEQRRSFVTSSPWFMLHFYRTIAKGGWHRDFWRPIIYTYEVEIYRNTARTSE